MSRKDYVLIADAIKSACPHEGEGPLRDVWEYQARTLSVALQNDNPRFDRPRFLAACGL